MKEIIALQEYTDKYISLYEGEIRNIQNKLADKLIEKGIVAEHGDSGSENVNSPLIISFQIQGRIVSLNKTYEEIESAYINNRPIIYRNTSTYTRYGKKETESITSLLYYMHASESEQDENDDTNTFSVKFVEIDRSNNSFYFTEFTSNSRTGILKHILS